MNNFDKVLTLKEKFDVDVVTWEEAIHDYDNSKNKNLFVKESSPNGFFVTHNINYLPRVKKVLDVLDLKIAHLYCNLTTKAPTFGEHTDSMDVYFWQCQGSTKWIVNEKIIILDSGDLLFIPKGIKHNVIPLCPRVGISMSYD